MQKNLISAIAGWKSAALLALVAMVAAVAFSGVLSTTQTAKAAIVDTPTGTGSDTTVNGNNGQIFYILNTEDTQYVQFEIATTGAASATFLGPGASADGQSITCVAGTTANPSPCDVAPNATGVTVAVKVDDDSGAGAIFIRQTVFAATGTPTVTTDTIRITVAQVPARISAAPVTPAINSAATTTATPADNVTVVWFRLTDTNGRGIGGQGLTITATHGTLSAATAAPAAWTGRDVQATTSGDDHNGLDFTGASQAGTITTSTDAGAVANRDGAGYAAVTLTGGGVSGIATVTARLTTGTVSGEAKVTLYGAQASITAEADSSAIALGEHTFIVVTVKDAAGNPVANATASTKAATGVVGPDSSSNLVSVARNVNKDNGTLGTLDARLGDLPACDNVTAVTAADQSGDPPAPPLAFGSTGTNAAGKCVLRVEAIGPSATVTNPMDFTSRGTHTLTIVASADGTDPARIEAAVVEIQVGGAPATISSDAPARIDPSDEITVNVTVVDDEDVRVGAVTIEVIQTAGDGTIITPARPTTSDGRASFTYLAPSTPGTAEFLVRTKAASGAVTAQLPIIVTIGAEPEPEPEPEPAPVLTWSAPIVSGWNSVVWQGEDGASVADNVGDGVTSVHQWNVGSQRFSSWFAGAEGVPTTVNDFSELENGGIYWVYSE